MKTVAIIQSNYIPWKGYFNIIANVDEFIFYDTAQYTPRTWRNRNRIKTPHGLQWLVIPVHHDYHHPRRICDTFTVDQHWRKKHWKNMIQYYGSATYFNHYRETFESLYLSHQDQCLSDINYRFISAINDMLGIKTPLTRLTDYELQGDKDGDLIAICKKAGATKYLSGPAGQRFLHADAFKADGIELLWASYDGYDEYRQFYPPFAHEVSIIDLLFHTGPDAGRYLRMPEGL